MLCLESRVRSASMFATECRGKFKLPNGEFKHFSLTVDDIRLQGLANKELGLMEFISRTIKSYHPEIKKPRQDVGQIVSNFPVDSVKVFNWDNMRLGLDWTPKFTYNKYVNRWEIKLTHPIYTQQSGLMFRGFITTGDINPYNPTTLATWGVNVEPVYKRDIRVRPKKVYEDVYTKDEVPQPKAYTKDDIPQLLQLVRRLQGDAPLVEKDNVYEVPQIPLLREPLQSEIY